MTNELKHHGIPGQKWGHKNGPPYPLDPSDHSAAERKAMTGSATKSTSRNTSGKLKGGITKINLSPEQKAKIKKAAKIGAVTVGVGLAVYGTYKTSTFVGPARTKAGMNAINALYKASQAPKQAGKIAKESLKNAGNEFIKGIPAGAGDMGSKMGKVVGGGIMALAAKELADIIVGEDTAKIVIDAYNSHNKKNKVSYNFGGKPNNSGNSDDD